MRIDSGAPIDTAGEQRRHAQYVPDESAMVNSHEIQQAILEIRLRAICDPKPHCFEFANASTSAGVWVVRPSTSIE